MKKCLQNCVSGSFKRTCVLKRTHRSNDDDKSGENSMNRTFSIKHLIVDEIVPDGKQPVVKFI